MEDFDEVMDLVDNDDQVLGTITRRQTNKLSPTDQRFYRVSTAFVQNGRSQLWIPRRQPFKQLKPNGLDFSVAEHVKAGETYEQAVVRGFKEELLLDVKPDELTLLGKLHPIPGHFIFTAVFLYAANDIKRYNKQDYTGFEWLYPEELAERLMGGEEAKDYLLPALKAFFIR